MFPLHQNTASMTTLGDYIAHLRVEKGWTMRELARKAGLSLGAIQKIENGSTLAPGIDAIIAIGQALRVPPLKMILAYQGEDPDTEPPLETDVATKVMDVLMENFPEQTKAAIKEMETRKK